ncbi:MAG TPA: DUF3987 domain-containing protein [Ktedonobacteraceae bacterium]|nr:DUF3987 domain-containing protein [Ktedonobacteraceae bacterium]
MTQTTDHLFEQGRAVYTYIQALCEGRRPHRPEDLGPYEPFVIPLETALNAEAPTAIDRTYASLKASNTSFQRFLARYEQATASSSVVLPGANDEGYVPSLPKKACLAEQAGRGACPWLDEGYIPFSKKWSPRGYELFHEATGLWLLSTIAARRVGFHFGGPQYTPLYIALVGITTLHRKSTTVKIATTALEKAGLLWLLSANVTTPQKLMSSMAGGSIPAGYAALSPEDQEQVKNRLAFSAQIGWFYEEFGMQLDAMVQKNGPMADFKGLLRILDDCLDTYRYDTVARGAELIRKPYLALLACMTPSDIRPYAGSTSKFWKDGLFARFAFIVPPAHMRNRDRFPRGEQRVPGELLRPLVDWHRRLGVPSVSIEPLYDKRGEMTEQYQMVREELHEHFYQIRPEIEDAFYTYEESLLDIAQEHGTEVLYGNYGRLPMKTLRIAALFASLANSPHIEFKHWARAQEVTEHWRNCFHELLAQVSEPEPTAEKQLEDKVLDVVMTLGTPTAREVAQRVHESTDRVKTMLDSLTSSGVLARDVQHRTIRYYYSPTTP